MKRFPTFLLLAALSISSTHACTQERSRAQKVIAALRKKGDYPPGGRDTLIDLNRDGYKDLLIEFYASSGTGEKNGVHVYLFHPRTKKFSLCAPLEYLANPSFYLDRKVVTGYYVGNGGGSATKLRWQGLRLTVVEQITIRVNNKKQGLSFTLTTFNYSTHKTSRKTIPVMALPDEYRYMDYKPVIKNGLP